MLTPDERRLLKCIHTLAEWDTTFVQVAISGNTENGCVYGPGSTTIRSSTWYGSTDDFNRLDWLPLRQESLEQPKIASNDKTRAPTCNDMTHGMLLARYHLPTRAHCTVVHQAQTQRPLVYAAVLAHILATDAGNSGQTK